MANKYIIHGAAFNGDGTSSAEATSNGGVGAWNTITYFEGTAPAYGTLAAGDVVYIRSKDAGGSNITRTLSANMNLGSASATYGSRITWVIDGGLVWSGVDGEVKYTSASSSFAVTLRNFNNLISEKQSKFVVENTLVNANQANLLSLNNCYVKNIKIDWSLGKAFNGNRGILASGNAFATVENMVMKAGKVHNQLVIFGSTNGGLHLINPDIELTVASTTAVVGTLSNPTKVTITGGRLYGAGATTGTGITAALPAAHSLIECYGFVYPNTVSIVQTIPSFSSFNGVGAIYAYGADGVAGAASGNQWGILDTRQDDNYPTLSAFLPTSDNKAWSYKIYPSEARSGFGATVLLSKIHTGDDAALNLNLEFLVSNSFAGLNASNIWVTGSYINSSGVPEYFTTHDLSAAALTTSTAGWSATTYGAITLLKRKIAVTTASAVKKDTMVMLRFHCEARSASSSDIIFVNPDF